METRDTGRRLLIISSEFPPDAGGIGNHAYNLALFFAGEKFRVTVIADQLDASSNVANALHSETPFVFKPVQRNSFLPITYLKRVILSVTHAGKHDWIICSGKFPLWIALILRLVYRRKKMIAVVHGTELDLKAKWARNLTSKALARFDTIISVSEFTKQLLPRGLPSRIPVFVIPNGIDIKEFAEVVTDHTGVLNGNDDVIPIITVGSLTERKGQHHVIAALPALLKLYPKLHYHMVGKPVEKEKLLKLAQKLGVAGSISFHGMLERTALIEILRKSAIKIMLSGHTASGDLEGFGIALLEANALGKPVIAARTGGIPDAVLDHRSGILVNAEDIDQLCAALKEILENYTAYSTHAKEWAATHDWNIIIRQYINVLNNYTTN